MWRPDPQVSVWSTSETIWQQSFSVIPSALCPDLLCYDRIGAADGWRGRIGRAFFWLTARVASAMICQDVDVKTVQDRDIARGIRARGGGT